MKLMWPEGEVKLRCSWARISAWERSGAKGPSRSVNPHWVNMPRSWHLFLTSHWADWPQKDVTLLQEGCDSLQFRHSCRDWHLKAIHLPGREISAIHQWPPSSQHGYTPAAAPYSPSPQPSHTITSYSTQNSPPGLRVGRSRSSGLEVGRMALEQGRPGVGYFLYRVTSFV